MHILGKILLGLTLILAGAATWATANTLKVRNEWLKSITTRREAYKKTIPEVSRTENELFRKRTEYDLLMQMWAPMIGADITIQPNASNGDYGIVLNGIGPLTGIRTEQIIHVFGVSQQDVSNYIGPFKVNVVDPNRSSAIAAWPLRQSETANWNGAFLYDPKKYRVYGSVPANAPENLLRYAQVLLSKDELLAAKGDLRDARAKEVKIANEHLNYRDIELHGNPLLEGDRGVLPDHMIDGQVKAIETLDEQRNLTVLKVDEIRHRLKLMYDEVQALRERNRQLVASLPNNDDVATSPDASVGE
jgi:hypothetical protein